MKSKIITGSILGVAVLFIGYFVVGIVFSFPSLLNPFYERCLDISQGMEKTEVNNQLQEFLNNSAYKTEEGAAGTYGWKGRLSYDTSLLVRLEKEPFIFEYDDLNHLTVASSTMASSTPFRQMYSYDAIGNITNKSDIGSYSYAETNYANPTNLPRTRNRFRVRVLLFV